MQLVNSCAIVHSRTPFEDFEEADRKRHLLRQGLAVPVSPPPAYWAEDFSDTRPGPVRGGPRGSRLKAEVAAQEQRCSTRWCRSTRPRESSCAPG